MLNQLDTLEKETLAQIETIQDGESLRDLRNATVGKKGKVTAILRAVGTLPADERPAVGQRANAVRVALEAAFDAREDVIRTHDLGKSLEEGAIDVTLPGRPRPQGRIHPINAMLREIYDIWADMGFQVYRSRDVEDDDMNFTALNIPPHHPARDMWDTFHTTQEGVILRTHTSPGQMHAMQEYAPEPIRLIVPGMVYRYEQIDATHEAQFTQVEGLAIGRNITLADLKGTMIAFAQRVYGAGRQVRFRCSHFPFTEPSVEVDVEWEGGWMEIAGAGMVHPVVLANGGYDPAEFSGFAFGMGPERIAMVKYQIEDIRAFWTNDLRWLEQF